MLFEICDKEFCESIRRHSACCNCSRPFSILGRIIRMRCVLRLQRGHQIRIPNLSIDKSQELRIHIVCVDTHFIFSSARSKRLKFKRIPEASLPPQSSVERRKKSLDLHAAAVIAKVERQSSIAPNVLLSHCLRLRFDLDLVWIIVSPCRTIPAADGTLAHVDVLGESRDCDCDCPAVAARADWGICLSHAVLHRSYFGSLEDSSQRCLLRVKKFEGNKH